MISCAVISVRHAALNAVDVELAVVLDELHQVDRRQVAGRVVQEHVLRARVAGVDASRVRAGVPLVDGGVELHAGIAAHPGAFGDRAHQVAGLVGVDHLAVGAPPWSATAPSSSTARMKSSVTRTLLFEFWKNTEP